MLSIIFSGYTITLLYSIYSYLHTVDIIFYKYNTFNNIQLVTGTRY